LEPGFIRFGYNHDMLQSLETDSATACTSSALAAELDFFWYQLD
jgi:hypothetical protein